MWLPGETCQMSLAKVEQKAEKEKDVFIYLFIWPKHALSEKKYKYTAQKN